MPSGFDAVFGGGATPQVFKWIPLERAPDWFYRQKNDVCEFRYISPFSGEIFEGVDQVKIGLQIRDARSVDVLQIDLGPDPRARQYTYVAVDAVSNITGVYLRDNDYPGLPTGWHTPDEIVKNAAERGFAQFAQNLLDKLKGGLRTAVKMRFDDVSQTFNSPIV